MSQRPSPFLNFNHAVVRSQDPKERFDQFHQEFKRWQQQNHTALAGPQILVDFLSIRKPMEGMVAWNFTTHVLTTYNGTTWV